MNTEVTFSSDRFRPVLPEDSQVNPGRYGAELAFWLCVQLAGHGIVTSYPNFEDWGWFLEYITADGDEFWLCCGNLDGFKDRWHCFVQAKGRWMFARNKPPLERSLELVEGLRRVLEQEPTVCDIEWDEGKRG